MKIYTSNFPMRGSVDGAVVIFVNLVALVLVAAGIAFDSMGIAVGIALGVLGAYFCAVKPLECGVTLLIAGPILLSSFRISSLTADNVAVIFGIVCLAVWGASGGSFRFTGTSFLPLLIAVSIVLSGLVNGTPFLQASIRFVSLALLASVLPAVNTVKILGLLRIVLSVGIVSIISQSFFGFPAPFYDADGSIRYGGLMGHPNFASYVVGAFIVFALSRKSLNRIDLVISLAGLYAMLLAASQTALLIVAVLCFVALVRFPGRLVSASIVAFGVIGVMGSTFLVRVAPFIESKDLASSESGLWRLNQWQAALNLVEQPNLFGIGWQQTKVLIGDGLGAHSAYVSAYVELGVVGSLLVLAGLMLVVKSVYRILPAAMVWVYFILCSVTDPVLFYPSCLCVGIVLTAIALNKDLGNVRISSDLNSNAGGNCRSREDVSTNS